MNAGQYPPSRPVPPAQAAPRPAQPHPGPPAQPHPGPPAQAPPGPAVLGAPAPPPVPAMVALAPPAPPQQVTQGSAGAASATTVEVARPALAVGIAAPLPPAPPAPGGAGGGPNHAQLEHRDWRTRRHRSIPRLRIGAHRASERALDLLQVSASSIGLRLGRDRNGIPVALTLFRPEQLTVSLIGGAWAARLMALRALRSGARLLVFTEQSTYWVQLGQSVTGRTDRVAVLAPGAAAGVTASADAPVLCLHEGAPKPEEPQPWQTRVLLHRRVLPDRVAAVRDSDLVLMQRLTPNEAALVAPALRLTPHSAQQLQLLRDDMMALVAGGGNHYVWLDQDPTELHRLGRPGRY